MYIEFKSKSITLQKVVIVKNKHNLKKLIDRLHSTQNLKTLIGKM